MNPMGALVAALGVVLIIIGWKGNQDKLLQAFTGKAITAGSAASGTVPGGGSGIIGGAITEPGFNQPHDLTKPGTIFPGNSVSAGTNPVTGGPLG